MHTRRIIFFDVTGTWLRERTPNGHRILGILGWDFSGRACLQLSPRRRVHDLLVWPLETAKSLPSCSWRPTWEKKLWALWTLERKLKEIKGNRANTLTISLLICIGLQWFSLGFHQLSGLKSVIQIHNIFFFKFIVPHSNFNCGLHPVVVQSKVEVPNLPDCSPSHVQGPQALMQQIWWKLMKHAIRSTHWPIFFASWPSMFPTFGGSHDWPLSTPRPFFLWLGQVSPRPKLMLINICSSLRQLPWNSQMVWSAPPP